MLVYNAIQTPDGTIIESKYRHNYVTHKDANGNTYAVDGGLDYLRRAGPLDYKELSISTNDHNIIREYLTWGTLEGARIKIKDLSTEHIKNILLATQFLSNKYINALEKEILIRIRD